MNSKIIILFLLIWMTVGVYAGCCFDSTNGICSENSIRESCESGGGIYDPYPCEFVNECTKGCCVLGTIPLYITERRCKLQSEILGFGNDFRLLSEENCLSVQGESSRGACIYATDYDTECYYSTPSECMGGEFHADTFCSDARFDSSCVRIEETICSEEGNVHYIDSCGNLDAKKEDCDYDTGKICEQADPLTAICRDLNCGAYSNGESWCAFEDLGPVGSQAFRQYCADGKVYTERCGDFRTETCESGSCVNNPASECLVANPDRTDDDYDDNDTSWKDECDDRYCEIYDSVKNSDYLKNSSESKGVYFMELDLDLCVPRVSQGSGFWKGTKEGTCSAGDFKYTVYFNHDKGNCKKWAVRYHEDSDDYFSVGLLSYNFSFWYLDDECNGFVSSSPLNPTSKLLKTGYEADEKISASDWEALFHNDSIPDERVYRILNERCMALGDCIGSENLMGDQGPKNESGHKFSCTDKDTDAIECKYSFTCEPYRAPKGDGACNQCNGGLPCSEYRCKSLGDQCKYVTPMGLSEGFCISEKDFSAPSISSSIKEEAGTNWRSSSTGNNFNYGEKIEVRISTNEMSLCKFNVGHSSAGNFNNISEYVDQEYSTTHEMRLSYPQQEKGRNTMPEHELLGDSGNIKLYVYCNDLGNNFNIAPHVINLEIGEPEDVLPPLIYDESFTPQSGSFVLYNTTSKLISFEVNEPILGCKYDLEEMDYSFMNKSFTCTGTSCLGVIDTTENENKIYIRCQDSKGNSNSQSKEYTLYRPQDALKIESLKPLKSYTTETSLTFNLELRVSGGSGDEVCSFKIQGYNEDYTEFLTHKGDYHIQELTLPLGVRNTFIRCVDSSNDAAVFTERISINQDINSPLISRAYGMGNSLVLKTTEKAECKYVLSDCNKKFEAMQSFTGNGLKHQATGRKGNIYYIKCMDNLGNIPGKAICSKIVRL